MSDTVRGELDMSLALSALAVALATSRRACDPYPTTTASGAGVGSTGPPAEA